MKQESQRWDLVIRSQRGWWDINLVELWNYRDLMMLFVMRDFVTFYKQTVLGPLWYVIQPLLTSVVFTVVFGAVAQLPTDGVPPFLFYMAGNVCWNYFSMSLTKTSNTFLGNAGMFGKVYFPRMVVPISFVVTNLAQFAVQFLIFIGFYAYYWFAGAPLKPTLSLLWLPLVLLQMALLGLGAGILISAVTTRYRDLVFALGFGVSLWMYATPVIYPASMVPEKYLWIYTLNPMVPIIEQFREAFFGTSIITAHHIISSWVVTLGLLIWGLVLFHRVERNFLDTV